LKGRGGGGGGLNLRVVWSLGAVDLGLAVDVLEKIEGLAGRMSLFITGQVGDGEREVVDRIEKMGAEVVERRLTKDDVMVSKYEGARRKYYLCVGPEMQKVLMGWLDGEEVVSESFNY
jgi:hypothetical protein